MAYELSEGTLYPLQTFKKGIDNPGDEQSLYEELKQFRIIVKSHEQLHEYINARYYPISEMNLGGIYQLNKDTDASSRMGVTRKMMTQV